MHPPLSALRAVTTIRRTVVAVDLVGYSTVARVLEENTSAASVAELNRRIQDFVRGALSSIPVHNYSLLSETGDGAILLFENAEQAHSFAEGVHQNSGKHNTTRTESSAHRLFRIGIATGEIVVDGGEGKAGYAGITIANAVRLESAAKPGEIVIDADTFQSLPAAAREKYSNESTVRGKREEVFRVRKYLATEPAHSPKVVQLAVRRMALRSLRSRLVLMVGVAAVVLVTLSWAVWRFYPRVQPFSSISTEQLTDSGDITDVAISPDGKTLAEVKATGGQHSIWMRNISTGKELQVLTPVRLDYGSLAFSKDGNELYFVRQDADNSVSYTLYSLPVFGGEPRLLARNLVRAISLSPDDQRIAFTRAVAGSDEVHTVDLSSGEDKVIIKAEGRDLSSPAWSSDGHTLAWISESSFRVRANDDHSLSHAVSLLNINSGRQRDISLPSDVSIYRLDWLPSGKHILMTFSMPYSGARFPGGQIGLVSIDSGDFRQLTNDMISHSRIALSADGMRIATLLQQSTSEVGFYSGSGTQLGPAVRLPRSASGIIWLGENKLFLDEFTYSQILSRENGQIADLELMYPKGQYGRLDDGTYNTSPTVCSDGSLIFTGSLNGVDQIYSFDSHGRFVRSLVKVRGGDMFCSSDNQFAYYSMHGAKDSSIWKVSFAGDEPTKVMSTSNAGPIVYSNDGRFAAYLTDSTGHSTATVIDLDQRTVVGDIPLTNHAPGTLAHFTHDGSALTFVELQDQGFAVASQPLNGSSRRIVTTWFRDPISDFAWSPSGKLLAILWDRSTSDVALIQDKADKTRD